MSTETASWLPRVGASSAASSPMPTKTPRAFPALLSARRKNRSINSNSVNVAIVAGPEVSEEPEGADEAFAPTASGRGTSAENFRRAGARGQLVQHAVDVFMSVRASVRLGELDGFVDRDPVGHLRLAQQLPRTDGQNALFHR